MVTGKEIVSEAFDAWSKGTRHVSEIFADEMTWEIVGESAAAGHYPSKDAFIDQVLRPFGQRFDPDRPFRPVRIRGTFADGDTVIVVWDGSGTTVAGSTYSNTYAWIMRLREGKVVDAVAFYDSLAFDRLWSAVRPVS